LPNPRPRTGGRHERTDPRVLGLRLTVLLSGGVSAGRGGEAHGRGGRVGGVAAAGESEGNGRVGRVDAVRVAAGAVPYAPAGGRVPATGVGAVGVPAGPAEGRQDPPAARVAAAAHAIRR